jgi:ferrous iron transport protein A
MLIKEELPTANGFRIQRCGLAALRLEMQVSVNKRSSSKKDRARNLTELKQGEAGVLEKLDLPEDDAQRLMEMGFVPGHSVTRGLSAPGGDPRVFRVDGSEVALRRETALRLILR